MRYVTGALFLFIASLPYLAMLRTGPQAPPGAATAPAETLAIVSPHRREVRLEYSRGFRDWMRERHGRAVDIRWLDVGGTSKILKDLESRFATSPDAPGVDLLFGGGVAPYLTAAQQGWLAAPGLDSAALEGIPPTCAGAPVHDPAGLWFGVALSGFGILYNRPLIERLGLPAPGDWEDLGRPVYFSWVGSGDPRSSGSVHKCYEIILQAYGFEAGWALLTRMSGNVRSFGEGGTSVPRDVAAGDIAAGLVIDTYAQTVIDSVGGDRLVLVLPLRHTAIGPDPVGMIRGTRRPELSRRFIEYALSDEGQRLLFQAEGTRGQQHALHRLPVRAALYRDPQAPRADPYAIPPGVKDDTERESRRWNALNDLLGIWLIDAHADLRRAWQQVIARGCPPEAVARLCAAPVREAELEALAEHWKDTRRRQAVTRQWTLEARERYRRVTAGE
jgi:ABC-type Fe3+ transport system substrate-binding protein